MRLEDSLDKEKVQYKYPIPLLPVCPVSTSTTPKKWPCKPSIRNNLIRSSNKKINKKKFKGRGKTTKKGNIMKSPTSTKSPKRSKNKPTKMYSSTSFSTIICYSTTNNTTKSTTSALTPCGTPSRTSTSWCRWRKARKTTKTEQSWNNKDMKRKKISIKPNFGINYKKGKGSTARNDKTKLGKSNSTENSVNLPNN